MFDFVCNIIAAYHRKMVKFIYVITHMCFKASLFGDFVGNNWNNIFLGKVAKKIDFYEV